MITYQAAADIISLAVELALITTLVIGALAIYYFWRD